MVFPLLTPGPTLSLSPLALLVPCSRPDFLFLHVGVSLHREESSSFPLFLFAPSLSLILSLSFPLPVFCRRDLAVSPTASRIGTFSPSPGFFDPPSRFIGRFSPVDRLSSSLPFSPSFDPHRRTRWTCISLGPTSPGILSSFPPWSKLLPVAVAVVGRQRDRLGGGRLASEDHGCTFSRPRSPQPRDARDTPIPWRYRRSVTDTEHFSCRYFVSCLNVVRMQPRDAREISKSKLRPEFIVSSYFKTVLSYVLRR